MITRAHINDKDAGTERVDSGMALRIMGLGWGAAVFTKVNDGKDPPG